MTTARTTIFLATLSICMSGASGFGYQSADPDDKVTVSALTVRWPIAYELPTTTAVALASTWTEVDGPAVDCETRLRRPGALSPTLVYDARGVLLGVELVVNQSIIETYVVEDIEGSPGLAVQARVRFRDPAMACDDTPQEGYGYDYTGLYVDGSMGSFFVSIDQDLVGDSGKFATSPSGCFPSNHQDWDFQAAGYPVWPFAAGMGLHYWPTNYYDPDFDCLSEVSTGGVFLTFGDDGTLHGFGFAAVSQNDVAFGEENPDLNYWEYPNNATFVPSFLPGEIPKCFDLYNAEALWGIENEIPMASMHFWMRDQAYVFNNITCV